MAVAFGGFRALVDVDLVARSDEVVGLIGPNGAGKTTMVNVMTGVVAPDAGQVQIDGHELTGRPPYDIARAGLARTFQNLRLFSDLTVRENVDIAVLERVTPSADRPAPDVDDCSCARRASPTARSGGRVSSTTAPSAGWSWRGPPRCAPAFLILDEPTSGMSDAESAVMIEHVRATAASVGAGVLVIDHDLHFITSICDRIYVLDQGEVIASGPPDVVRQDPKVVAAYLGTPTP